MLAEIILPPSNVETIITITDNFAEIITHNNNVDNVNKLYWKFPNCWDYDGYALGYTLVLKLEIRRKGQSVLGI
jgi:hypothetical protein